MAILAQNPITTPPVIEKVFTDLWLSQIQINAPINNDSIVLSGIMDIVRTRDDGSKEPSPQGRKQIQEKIKFADLTTEEQTLMYSLVSVVAKRLGLINAE
jgi:hypothetical protein